MKAMLLEYQKAFCAALYQDFGKSPFEQRFEITVPTGVIDNYLANLETYMAPEPVTIPQGTLRIDPDFSDRLIWQLPFLELLG